MDTGIELVENDQGDTLEDFEKGTYSIPVTHGFLLSGRDRISQQSIFQGLFGSGLFESLLSYAIENLEKSIEYVQEINNAETEILGYFKALKSYIHNVKEQAREIRGYEIEHTSDFTQLSNRHLDYVDIDTANKILQSLEPALIAPGEIKGIGKINK